MKEVILPFVSKDYSIHQQVNEVVNDKRLLDTWEASRHSRGCGCYQCKAFHMRTLVFYNALGSEKPAIETIAHLKQPIDIWQWQR